MKVLQNKYFLIPLAVLFYVLIMFVIKTPFVSITKELFKYDFYSSIINFAKPFSFFYENSYAYIASLNVFLELFVYTLIFIILFIVLYRYIISDLHGFIRYYNNFIKTIFISFLIYYFVNIAINIITIMLEYIFNSNPISQNQASLESIITFDFYGLMMIIPLVIIGPLVEELIFRKCFFTIIPNKIVAFVLNCLCFGLLHTISYNYSLSDLLIVTLPYCFAGVAFSYCYLKTNNVFASYILHAALNFISYCLIILTNIGGL